MRWHRAVLFFLVSIPVGLIALIWFSNQGFEAMMVGLRDRVVAPADRAGTPAELPDIVRAYALRAGGRVGGPDFVHLQHQAALQTDQSRPPMDMVTDQWVASYRTEFAWIGRGSMFGVPVSVIDSFVAGQGLLEARLLGTVPVAKGVGGEFDKGELQRYLSELPVHPDAILNNGHLVWRQIDDLVVEVTGTSGTSSASVRLFFDAAGDIVALEAPDRPMTQGSKTVPTMWRGSFSAYKQFGRYRIPSYGEVSWILPIGPFTYWRGKVVAYEPAELL